VPFQKQRQTLIFSLETNTWKVLKCVEKISWTDRVRNEDVLHRVKEERNILHTIKRRKANWIGHILRKKCSLKHVIGGKIVGKMEVTGRRVRRRKQLMDDLKDAARGSTRSHSV
jgi:hypothetical protein